MAYRKRQKKQMSADEAASFEKFSIGNATVLAQAAVERGCQCQPYADWFTFRRWLAQGMHVRKGEHGTALTVLITKEKEDGSTSTYPKRTHVFCRCQVEPNEVREAV